MDTILTANIQRSAGNIARAATLARAASCITRAKPQYVANPIAPSIFDIRLPKTGDFIVRPNKDINTRIQVALCNLYCANEDTSLELYTIYSEAFLTVKMLRGK